MGLSLSDVQFMVCEPGARSAWTNARKPEAAQAIADDRYLTTGKPYVVETWEEFDKRTNTLWLSDSPLRGISAEEYDDALGVLPPLYRSDAIGFFMSEFTAGYITNQYAQYDGRYYVAAVDMMDRGTWITAEKIAAMPPPLPISPERARFILANGRDGYSWNFEKPTHESLFTPEESEAMQTYFALHAKGNESRNSILHKCARADIVEGKPT